MSEFIDLKNYNGAPFHLFQDQNVKNNKSNNLTGNFCKNDVSKLFFSQTNIDYIQDRIIDGIFKKRNEKISKQSEDELLIVMRSIYLQFGKNMVENIQSQINDLNNRVLNYCIPNIETNMKQYTKYIEDITSERDILDMPENVGIKGENNQLMPNHFF